MRRFASVLAAASWVVAASPAVAVVINNGLAPPTPANVLNAANSFPTDTVFVTNLGCDAALPPSLRLAWDRADKRSPGGWRRSV